MAEADTTNGLDFAAHTTELNDYLIDRAQQLLTGTKIRHDIVDADSVRSDADIAGILDAE